MTDTLFTTSAGTVLAHSGGLIIFSEGPRPTFCPDCGSARASATRATTIAAPSDTTSFIVGYRTTGTACSGCGFFEYTYYTPDVDWPATHMVGPHRFDDVDAAFAAAQFHHLPITFLD